MKVQLVAMVDGIGAVDVTHDVARVSDVAVLAVKLAKKTRQIIHAVPGLADAKIKSLRIVRL